MKKLLSIFIPVILALTAYRYYNHPHQPLEIHFRHSLRGDLGQALEEVVDTFNKSHPSYKVILEYGGDYNESFAKTFQGKKATHIHQRPHLLMVAEFNTLTIKKQEGDYIPLPDHFPGMMI